MNIQRIILFFIPIFISCGLSDQEKETLKNHFREIAAKQCECNQLKAKTDPSYSACVQEYEQSVRYMEAFIEVTKPSESEKKLAASDSEQMRSQCK